MAYGVSERTGTPFAPQSRLLQSLVKKSPVGKFCIDHHPSHDSVLITDTLARAASNIILPVHRNSPTACQTPVGFQSGSLSPFLFQLDYPLDANREISGADIHD